MAHARKTYDVFITHSARDTALALDVASACRESGLEAVTLPSSIDVAMAGALLWTASDFVVLTATINRAGI
jgi:hypothetical protein